MFFQETSFRIAEVMFYLAQEKWSCVGNILPSEKLFPKFWGLFEII